MLPISSRAVTIGSSSAHLCVLRAHTACKGRPRRRHPSSIHDQLGHQRRSCLPSLVPAAGTRPSEPQRSLAFARGDPRRPHRDTADRRDPAGHRTVNFTQASTPGRPAQPTRTSAHHCPAPPRTAGSRRSELDAAAGRNVAPKSPADPSQVPHGLIRCALQLSGTASGATVTASRAESPRATSDIGRAVGQVDAPAIIGPIYRDTQTSSTNDARRWRADVRRPPLTCSCAPIQAGLASACSVTSRPPPGVRRAAA